MSDSDSFDDETPVRPRSEQVPRIHTIHKREKIKEQIKEDSDGGQTKVMSNNAISFVMVILVVMAGIFGYMNYLNLGRTDPQLARDDCVDLYRKYNCSDNGISGKICQYLNGCVFSTDRRCLLASRDSNGEDEQENFKENGENIGLILLGIVCGALKEHFFRLRHHLKSIPFAVLSGLFGIMSSLANLASRARKAVK